MCGIATLTIDVSISSSTDASVTAIAIRYLYLYLSASAMAGAGIATRAVPRGPAVIVAPLETVVVESVIGGRLARLCPGDHVHVHRHARPERLILPAPPGHGDPHRYALPDLGELALSV